VLLHLVAVVVMMVWLVPFEVSQHFRARRGQSSSRHTSENSPEVWMRHWMALASTYAPKLPFGGLYPKLPLPFRLTGSMFPLQAGKTDFVSPSWRCAALL